MSDVFERYANKLVANEIIEAEDKELYTYGFKQILVVIANILTTFLIGFIFGMIWQSIMFLAVYIPLRSYAGGFHARTQIRCYLLSVLMISVFLQFIKLTSLNIYVIVGMLTIGSLAILLMAPVEDTNKPLDDLEIIVYRKRTIIILFCEIAVTILALIFGLELVAKIITTSICLVAFMLLIGKLKRD